MSYSIEGVGPSGMDAEKLFEQLQADYGVGVAKVGMPIEAVLIDRKAVSWPAVLLWVEQWITFEGGESVTCEAEQPGHGMMARFSFEA